MARAASSKPSSTNVFGGAPTIAAPPSGSRSKLAERVLNGLQEVVAFNAVIAALEAIKADREKVVKDIMRTGFIADGLAQRRQPDNFRGIDGVGTDCPVSAACVLKASSSALNDDAIALFKAHGFDSAIHFTTNTTTTDALLINPAYTSDPNFLKMLENKFGKQFAELQDVRGPIIQHQEGVTKVTVSEAGRHEIFAKELTEIGDMPYTEATVEELVEIAFSLAITPKLETNGNLQPALNLVEKVLGSPLFHDVATEAATSASALNKKTKDKASKKAA
jgi:hypothetical protein